MVRESRDEQLKEMRGNGEDGLKSPPIFKRSVNVQEKEEDRTREQEVLPLLLPSYKNCAKNERQFFIIHHQQQLSYVLIVAVKRGVLKTSRVVAGSSERKFWLMDCPILLCSK